MIIRDKNIKVLFIHIPKTGGMSISETLKNSLNIDDSRIEINVNKHIFLHSTLLEYEKYIKDIEDFYIFSFVRNPWRRMVSHWEHLINNEENNKRFNRENIDFTTFVKKFHTGKLPFTNSGGYQYYFKSNKGVKLNKIGKLENIKEDLIIIGNEINIPIKDILYINKTDESKKIYNNWKNYYNGETKSIIYNMFREDIKYFEYEFDE